MWVRIRASRHSKDSAFIMLNRRSILIQELSRSTSDCYVTNLETFTRMKVFCEERVFISTASSFSGRSSRLAFLILRESSLTFKSGVAARPKEVSTGVFVDSAAALRKSVNDREVPSFLRLGASLFESHDVRGFCNNRADSKEDLDGGGCPEGRWDSAESRIARWVSNRFLPRRAGQTYSMIRWPRRASSCRRMG